jgi:cobalt/nickel transport protein
MRAAAFLVLLYVAAPALGHYHILLPAEWSAKKDEMTKLRLMFGHPYEHQLFDCGPPVSVVVHSPDGPRTELKTKMEKIEVAGFEGKKVTAYEIPFQPSVRGDYVFEAKMKRVWMEEEGEFWEDTVRVVLHVQAQKGWDAPVAVNATELVPLTRPYGLPPGNVFQALARDEHSKVLPGALVEVERYNAEAPKKLPPDEFITRTLKTDPSGVATTTLPDAGWWAVTTSRKVGEADHEGKKVPVRQRATIWVYVSEPPK